MLRIRRQSVAEVSTADCRFVGFPSLKCSPTVRNIGPMFGGGEQPNSVEYVSPPRPDGGAVRGGRGAQAGIVVAHQLEGSQYRDVDGRGVDIVVEDSLPSHSTTVFDGTKSPGTLTLSAGEVLTSALAAASRTVVGSKFILVRWLVNESPLVEVVPLNRTRSPPSLAITLNDSFPKFVAIGGGVTQFNGGTDRPGDIA